jgi:3'(2'), 5'-bisphosphate nucleotidase
MKVDAYASLLEKLLPIVHHAGSAIMNIYAGNIDVRTKSDASPVTKADELAEALILPALQALDRSIPIVAEEQAAAGNTPKTGNRFWLVDPLDGTKEFISRNGEFTVNIALIENGVPVLGVVLAPALKRLFAGGRGLGAFVEENGKRKAIQCRPVPAAGLTVVASRSHGNEAALARFLDGAKVASQTSAGSSLKLCLLAAGEADVYPRLGPTMEWDIAAGDAVLRAAGGRLITLDNKPMVYGKPTFANPHFSAWGLRAGDRF